MAPSPEPKSKGRNRILEAIDRPLGFYVLALLIVETFLGFALNAAGAEACKLRFWGMLLGVGMFVYITLTVTVIVWFKAHVLLYDRDAHLRDRRAMGPFGSEKKPLKSADTLQPPESLPGAK